MGRWENEYFSDQMFWCSGSENMAKRTHFQYPNLQEPLPASHAHWVPLWPTESSLDSSIPAFTTLYWGYLDLILSRQREKLPLSSSSSYKKGWWSLPQTSIDPPEPPQTCSLHWNYVLIVQTEFQDKLPALVSNQIVAPAPFQYPDSRGRAFCPQCLARCLAHSKSK